MSARQRQQPGGRDDDRWLDEWDCTPRDGPAVFVIDTVTYDLHGTRWGRWLDPTRGPEEVRADLVEAIGVEKIEHDEWAVIDQVGLGETALPEQVSIEGLVRIARLRVGGAS